MDSTTLEMVKATQKYLTGKLETANQRVEIARTRLATLEQEAAAIDHVLSGHVALDVMRLEGETGERTAELIRSLDGKSIREAVLLIAEHNDGEVTNDEAVRIIVEAGIMPDKDRTARARVWDVLQDEDRFSKIERGRYRLLPVAEEYDGTDAAVDAVIKAFDLEPPAASP